MKSFLALLSCSLLSFSISFSQTNDTLRKGCFPYYISYNRHMLYHFSDSRLKHEEITERWASVWDGIVAKIDYRYFPSGLVDSIIINGYAVQQLYHYRYDDKGNITQSFYFSHYVSYPGDSVITNYYYNENYQPERDSTFSFQVFHEPILWNWHHNSYNSAGQLIKTVAWRDYDEVTTVDTAMHYNAAGDLTDEIRYWKADHAIIYLEHNKRTYYDNHLLRSTTWRKNSEVTHGDFFTYYPGGLLASKTQFTIDSIPKETDAYTYNQWNEIETHTTMRYDEYGNMVYFLTETPFHYSPGGLRLDTSCMNPVGTFEYDRDGKRKVIHSVYTCHDMYSYNEDVYFEDTLTWEKWTPQIDSSSVPVPFTLSPNPASSTVSINFGYVVAEGQIIIYDLEGRTMIQYPVEQSGSVNINVSSLANGFYVVKFLGGKNPWSQKLIVGKS